jgi:hypothetical protein
MKLMLICCAEGIAVDTQTNNVTLFNILEEIQPRTFPFAWPSFRVLSVMAREPDDPDEASYLLKIRVGDTEIYSQSVDFTFGEKQRHRQILNFQGMPIPEPGVLRVEALVGDGPPQSWEVLVQAPSAPVEAPSASAHLKHEDS